MRKILLTATAALLGWNAPALANPPAAPSEHGSDHHDAAKEDHHDTKGDHKGAKPDDHHDEHHDAKDHADKPKG